MKQHTDFSESLHVFWMAAVSGIYCNFQWNKTPYMWQGASRESCHQECGVGISQWIHFKLDYKTKIKLTNSLLFLTHWRANTKGKKPQQDITRSTWYIIIFWSWYMAWLLNILSSCLVWVSALRCSAPWMWLLSPCTLLITHPLEQQTACKTHHQSGSWHIISFLS